MFVHLKKNFIQKNVIAKKIASDIENNTENDLIDNNFGA